MAREYLYPLQSLCFSFYPSWGNQLDVGSENHAVEDFLLDHFKEMILRSRSCEGRLGQVPSSSSLLYVTYLCVSGEGEQVTLGYWRSVENLSGGCCAQKVLEACHDAACLLNFGRYTDEGPWI